MKQKLMGYVSELRTIHSLMSSPPNFTFLVSLVLAPKAFKIVLNFEGGRAVELHIQNLSNEKWRGMDGRWGDGEGANLCSPVIVIISLLLWLTRSDPHVAPGQRQSPRRGRLS